MARRGAQAVRVQVITDAIYKHPHGQELRALIEPEDKNDLLWSSVERFDFTPLEAKAAGLRDVLLQKRVDEDNG